MSTTTLFQDHYLSLLQDLPMNDPTFVAALFTNGLLPGDLNDTIHSLPTKPEKAAQLLDKVIEPSIKINDYSSLNKLLRVMKESDYDRMKQLAATIDRVCLCLCVCMYCVSVLVCLNHPVS